MIEIFSNVACDLGEGPLWHAGRESLFWLDINKQRLYEKGVSSTKASYDNYWQLPEIGSALALDGNNEASLFIITDKHFGRFDLKDGIFTPIVKLNLKSGMRANDGGVAPDGTFWFGTMEKRPTGTNGSIYSISPKGELTNHNIKIGIPNTFCWSADGEVLYVSDSFKQKMFACNNKELTEIGMQENFVDLCTTVSTPDGGAMDNQGNLWNAQWDGFKIQAYDNNANQVSDIQLPTPQVTSCCFGGPQMKHLFITTAREGMAKSNISKYPLSGNTFVISSELSGQAVPAFFMDEKVMNIQENASAC